LNPGFLVLNDDALQSLHGKGHYDSFLRFNDRFSQEGFNTDYRENGRAPLDATSAPGGDHALRLGSLQTVTVEGTEYYAFRLDVHGPASSRLEDLTLDALRFYVADRGDIESLSALASEGNLRWDMGAMGVGRLGLGPDRLARGSGHDWTDILIPRSAFAGADPSKYLYLYSKFGAASGDGGERPSHGTAQGGFQEWHAYVEPPPVAEPGTLLLVATGLFGAALAWRKWTG
jgi:hypothetical protein